MDLSSMKNFEIACLHLWERSWLDKMRMAEFNSWTLDRSTNPKERTNMAMQFSSVVRMIDPTRSTGQSPTTSENHPTVGPPTCHYRHHASRLQIRRTRVRGFGPDWGADPTATINSVTERNDGTRGGKELMAFVDSGAVDNVLPKSVCTEYPLEAISKSQSGVGCQGGNGSHIKHCGQRRFRVKTSAGSNVNTTWEVADVRKPLISGSCLLEIGEAEDPMQEWRHAA